MRPARAYLCACAGTIAYVLGYALPIFGRLPNLFYDPVHRSAYVGARTGPIPMGYFGQLLYGLTCALVAVAVTYAMTGKRSSPPTGATVDPDGLSDGKKSPELGEPSDTTVGLMAAWTLSAFGLVAAYFTWNNWP